MENWSGRHLFPGHDIGPDGKFYEAQEQGSFVRFTGSVFDSNNPRTCLTLAEENWRVGGP